jgi:hypothetical protein
MFRCASIRRFLPLAAAMLCCNLAVAQQDAKPAKKCKPKDTACNSAQSPSDASGSSSQPQSMHDQFPFPTEDSKHGDDAEGPPSAPPASAPKQNGLPQMPTDPVPDPPAGSEKPMHIPRNGDDAAGSSGSSSSSSSADDDSDVAPTTEAPNAPVKSAPLKNYGAKDSTEVIREKLDKTRVPDDIKVGKYYMDAGNTQGAYLRFKDAVGYDPEDPDARFYLAEAASKLKHRDEAVTNYQECLKLDPGGDHDKAARRALTQLGISAK